VFHSLSSGGEHWKFRTRAASHHQSAICESCANPFSLPLSHLTLPFLFNGASVFIEHSRPGSCRLQVAVLNLLLVRLQRERGKEHKVSPSVFFLLSTLSPVVATRSQSRVVSLLAVVLYRRRLLPGNHSRQTRTPWSDEPSSSSTDRYVFFNSMPCIMLDASLNSLF